ncbi:MAG: hypothetical protein AAF402_11775 [Pseudomonadota bacterium]
MIRAFSQRLMPPFSGQIQIAESDKYRALTLDGDIWEIQYVKRTHVRVATLSASDIKAETIRPELMHSGTADEQIVEMLRFLADIKLPFAATDRYEYWLMDAKENFPLALIYSCSEPEQMAKFPERPEWTALPAAVMPIEKTEEELRNNIPPVNYRLERLVAERAGQWTVGRWFNRDEVDECNFPKLMVTENWHEESEQHLFERYIQRQAPRLLMLHGLDDSVRQQLEGYCRPYASEVGRFCGLYPKIMDTALIRTLRVEARLTAASGDGHHSAIHNRRDGILYI